MQEIFSAGDRPIHIRVHEPAISKPFPAIVLLHGAGGNVGFWADRMAPVLLGAGVALYAPHYFDRTGTNYADLATITDGLHVPQWIDTVDAALQWVAARPGIDPARIALVGVSLGAFLSLSFAAKLSAQADPARRRTMRCVVELSGGLVEPFRSEATSSFPPTLVLHGEADAVVPVSQAHELDALLTKLGVAHQTRILPREGHWFSTTAQMQLLLAVSDFLGRYLLPK